MRWYSSSVILGNMSHSRRKVPKRFLFGQVTFMHDINTGNTRE